jgi:hypothetical protein
MKKALMISLDVDILAETDRQIAEINTGRRKGNKLNRSIVIERMLVLFNKVSPNGNT